MVVWERAAATGLTIRAAASTARGRLSSAELPALPPGESDFVPPRALPQTRTHHGSARCQLQACRSGYWIPRRSPGLNWGATKHPIDGGVAVRLLDPAAEPGAELPRNKKPDRCQRGEYPGRGFRYLRIE